MWEIYFSKVLFYSKLRWLILKSRRYHLHTRKPSLFFGGGGRKAFGFKLVPKLGIRVNTRGQQLTLKNKKKNQKPKKTADFKIFKFFYLNFIK